MAEKIQLVIKIRAGTVFIPDVPKGVEVVVKDYDVEGIDAKNLSIDSYGHEYVESVYDGDVSQQPLV
jgi:hypothetical protein